MDERVDKDKHPDGWAHVADACPHAKHGARVMVRLQCRTSLALCQNDQSIHDLVELADIEDPAPERESLVPQPAIVRGVWITIGAQTNRRVLHLPNIDRAVESGSVTETSRAVDLAQRICSTCQSILVAESGPGVSEGPAHGQESGRGVDGEQRIVNDYKGLEPFLPRDCPWFVVALAIVGIEQKHADNVGAGEADGHLRLQSEVEEILVNAEGRAK